VLAELQPSAQEVSNFLVKSKRLRTFLMKGANRQSLLHLKFPAHKRGGHYRRLPSPFGQVPGAPRSLYEQGDAKLHTARPEIAILVEAMLRAHDVLACCTYRSKRILAPIHHQPGGEKKRLISS
jgi:hypothetical protein